MSGKRVAILQSNYIPWKGYFDMIASVDEFILYDDAQYTRSDWRNRNQVKTAQGVQWITVPVRIKGRLGQAIRETEIEGDRWAETHWRTLEQNYRGAKCFRDVAAVVEPLYRKGGWSHLTALNRAFIDAVCGFLGIATRITWSWDYELAGGKTERLAHLCRQACATQYVSGPAARSYLEEDVMSRHGIAVEWFDYSGYPEYPQLFGEFVHGVTVLDLLFNCGRDARRYMKHVAA
jgi:hypothetical protein